MPNGIPEGHYEFDTSSNDEPFWEPASVEDELKNQLQHLTLTQDALSWVWSPLLDTTFITQSPLRNEGMFFIDEAYSSKQATK